MSETDNIAYGAGNNDAGRNEARVSLGATGTPPGEDKLMAYLDGKLLPEEQYEIEKWLSDEGMESDAMEGLRTLPADDSKNAIKRLNQNLDRTLKFKNRKKRQAKPDQTILVAIVIILLLSVAAYIVIRFAAGK